MSRGNEIIVSANPRGVFLEGKLDTGVSAKPGTILQIKGSAGIDANGRYTFELYAAGADGNRPKGPLVICLQDYLSGKVATDAHAAGSNVIGYVPYAGEQFNLLLGDVAGTADDHALGEMLMVDHGTGKLVASTGTPQSTPFLLLEAVTDPTADTLAFVIYSGH